MHDLGGRCPRRPESFSTAVVTLIAREECPIVRAVGALQHDRVRPRPPERVPCHATVGRARRRRRTSPRRRSSHPGPWRACPVNVTILRALTAQGRERDRGVRSEDVRDGDAAASSHCERPGRCWRLDPNDQRKRPAESSAVGALSLRACHAREPDGAMTPLVRTASTGSRAVPMRRSGSDDCPHSVAMRAPMAPQPPSAA